MERCGWCLCNEAMMKYHDEESELKKEGMPS